MIDAELAQQSKRDYRKHGFGTLKPALKQLGSRAIDRRTSLGKALDPWRVELIAALGGLNNVSTQELAIIQLAVKTKLIVDSIDAWLLQQPTLVNKWARVVLPVALQRRQVADGLAGYITQLGLKNRAKAAPLIPGLLGAEQRRNLGTCPP